MAPNESTSAPRGFRAATAFPTDPWSPDRSTIFWCLSALTTSTGKAGLPRWEDLVWCVPSGSRAPHPRHTWKPRSAASFWTRATWPAWRRTGCCRPVVSQKTAHVLGFGFDGDRLWGPPRTPRRSGGGQRGRTRHPLHRTPGDRGLQRRRRHGLRRRKSPGREHGWAGVCQRPLARERVRGRADDSGVHQPQPAAEPDHHRVAGRYGLRRGPHAGRRLHAPHSGRAAVAARGRPVVRPIRLFERGGLLVKVGPPHGK